MKKLRTYSLLIIGLCCFFRLSTFGQVNVSVQILPPYPTKFTDYASRPQLMIIMLTNTSSTAKRIQLRGAVTGDNGISIRSKPGYRSSAPIELGAGQSRNLNGNDIAYFFDYSNLQYDGITQAEFINKGGLPEGRYQLCLRAFNYDDNTPLSMDEPSGCSNSFTISSLEPPVIISPMNEQEISSGAGQILMFRWNTPVSTPPGIQYRIRMVEILGNRNPNDALMTATQPYFFEREVMTNMYTYGPADPQLTPGRMYAMMVEAFDPMNNAVFRNNGRSEVIMFTYMAPPSILPTEVVKVKNDTLPTRTTLVKGNLKYRFPESPESGVFALSNTRVYLEKVYVTEVVDAVKGNSWKQVSNAVAARTPFLTNPTDSVIASTDKNGNFEIKLAMTVLDSAGKLSSYHKSLLQNNESKYADKSSAALLRNSGGMAIMYRLKFSNPHFKADDQFLNIVPGDTIDLQQKTVNANSYQLNVNVTETFNGYKGKFVPGAKVRIYRLKADKTNRSLEIPLYEGDLLDSAKNWKEYGDKVLIAEALTPTPDSLTVNNQANAKPFTAAFKRLFRNIAQDGYHYLISLEKGEQVLSQASFDQLTSYKATKRATAGSLPAKSDQVKDVWEDFAYNQPSDTTNLTLNKEITASPRSKITGTLKYAFKYYAGVPSQPYANMRVSLRSSANMKTVVATTVTDANGKFTFDFANVDSISYVKLNISGRGTVNIPTQVYYVVPEVKYYAIPNDKIIVQPWENSDCGELTSMVRTYSLKIDAQGENYQAASIGKVDQAGKKIPDVPAVLDPMGQAEILVLRYTPETYKNQIPNLIGMNTDQKISFGNSDASNNFTTVNSQPASGLKTMLYPVTVAGEMTNRSSNYVLQRKMYTEANGSTVTIKGLIPSINVENDRYQIRVGSGDRVSNNVAYETDLFHFPEWRNSGSIPPIQVIEEVNAGNMFEKEHDKLYDPSWGYADQVQFDPGGALMQGGLTATQMLSSQGLNVTTGMVIGAGISTGAGINKTVGKAMSSGKVGLSIGSTAALFHTKEWQNFTQSLKESRMLNNTKPVAIKRAVPGFYVAGPIINDTVLVFNNDLPAQEEEFEELRTILKKEWRIAGRTLDGISRLGPKGSKVYFCQTASVTAPNYYSLGGVPANDNGDFVFTKANLSLNSTGYKPERSSAIRIVTPGYNDLLIELGTMTDGKQYYNEQILLDPLGAGLYGYVVDNDHRKTGVAARIKMVDNGNWVNSEVYSGKMHVYSQNFPQDMNQTVDDAQRFQMKLPTTTVKLVIMPYDRGYLSDTVSVTVKQGKFYLGTFALTKRKHKMVFYVKHLQDKLVPAVVTIVENGLKDTVDINVKSQVYASFEFENNATKNFTVHVQPLNKDAQPGLKLFVPQTFTLDNDDDGQVKYQNLNVSLGRKVSGKVSFDNGSPVKNAKVYLESGAGTATDNFAMSKTDGAYQMILPELGIADYTIRANYFEEGKTYVSSEKLTAANDTIVNLTIKEIQGIDISRLLGFKTRITTLSESGNGTYTISGELYDIPVNGNFRTTDSILNRNLVFNDLKIKASLLKNAAGVALAVPIDNTIITDNKEIAVKVNNAFNGILQGETEKIVISKSSSDTSGTITGQLRILDNSFQFPSSYMRMENTDFYLGINKGAEAFTVFKSNNTTNESNNTTKVAERFLLTTKTGTPISFRYLGFKGVAETQGIRTSNLKGESIQLFMTLSTTLPGNIPLSLKAGQALITKGGLGKIITTDSLSFKIENWTVTANADIIGGTTPKGMNKNTTISKKFSASTPSWELSPASGGLVLKKGEILTGKINIPFKNMTIIPSEEAVGGDLTCQNLTDSINTVSFNVGGIAKLKIKNGASAAFIYDPGVGSDGGGHYKLSIASADFNDYAASFTGMDGMTNARDAFKIQMVSILSNGEEMFGFANDQSITYYNQIKFMPKTLSSTSQNSLSIAGTVDLGIPGLNTRFFESLLYTKEGNKNKVTMPVFDFSFLGKGGVKFTTKSKKEAQQFRPEGFVIVGDLSLPGGVNLNGGKLISMVSSGGQELLNATGIASAIPAGVTQEIEKQVDVVFGAKAQFEAYFNEAKDQVEAAQEQLKAEVEKAKQELLDEAEKYAKDAATKLIPMGEDEAKGALGDLAGTWKLGNSVYKQGQDVATAVKEGDYMKLAGMMKNVPGVDSLVKDVKNRVTMEARNVLTAAQEKLPDFKDVPVSGDGFEAGNFEFDLKNGKVYGSITFKIITLGAVTLRDGGMEMLFDRNGWYFCSGATMDIPVPILTPLKVGLLIGNYSAITDEIEARVTTMAQSASKRLPPAVKRGLSGFFIVGGKPIFDVNMGFGVPGIAEFKLVASAGAEVRTYALFGQNKFTIGMGALAFGRVYASASMMGVSVKGGAEVDVAVASSATFAGGKVGFCAQGCLSINFYVEACILGGCGGLNANIMALLNIGVGDNGILSGTGCKSNGVNFSISTAGGNCINNPNFDF